MDCLKVVDLINRFALKLGKVQRVFVQVNISGEEQKGGVVPEKLFEFMKEVGRFSNVIVEGIMCIGRRGLDNLIVGQSGSRRREFREMRGLFDRLNRFGYGLSELSMGMSGDYIVAIEEGSTMVRIGGGVFE